MVAHRLHAGHAVLVRVLGDLPQMAGVEAVSDHNGALKLTLAAETNPQDILQQLLRHHATVERFEIAIPTLDEIFIRTVSDETVS